MACKLGSWDAHQAESSVSCEAAKEMSSLRGRQLHCFDIARIDPDDLFAAHDTVERWLDSPVTQPEGFFVDSNAHGLPRPCVKYVNRSRRTVSQSVSKPLLFAVEGLRRSASRYYSVAINAPDPAREKCASGKSVVPFLVRSLACISL